MSHHPLNQEQTEALINLMVLGMYADGHLSLLEDESLNQFIDSIGWDSASGRTVFLTDAINRASSLNSEAEISAYTKQQAEFFISGAEKDTALHYFNQFLGVDGVSPDEASLSAKFRQALGL